MKPNQQVALALMALGALQVFGLLALLPQCGFSFNFWIVSGCSSPITVFGFNPNLFAGMVLLGFGYLLWRKKR